MLVTVERSTPKAVQVEGAKGTNVALLFVIQMRLDSYCVSALNPSDITVCIDPANHAAEGPTKALRFPFVVILGMDRRGDSASVESEINLQVGAGSRLAMPRTIEVSLLDRAAQFRNEPLHTASPFPPLLPADNLFPALAATPPVYGLFSLPLQLPSSPPTAS
jgi:hypothetical protein